MAHVPVGNPIPMCIWIRQVVSVLPRRKKLRSEVGKGACGGLEGVGKMGCSVIIIHCMICMLFSRE